MNGAFQGRSDRLVNYVNAPLIAAEREIKIIEERERAVDALHESHPGPVGRRCLSRRRDDDRRREPAVARERARLPARAGAGAAARLLPLRRRPGGDREGRHAVRRGGGQHRQHDRLCAPVAAEGADGACQIGLIPHRAGASSSEMLAEGFDGVRFISTRVAGLVPLQSDAAESSIVIACYEGRPTLSNSWNRAWPRSGRTRRRLPRAARRRGARRGVPRRHADRGRCGTRRRARLVQIVKSLVIVCDGASGARARSRRSSRGHGEDRACRRRGRRRVARPEEVRGPQALRPALSRRFRCPGSTWC